MAVGIGLRVHPGGIFFTIVKELDSGDYEFLAIDNIIIPKALDTPTTLSYLRTTIISILMEFQVTNAGIRIAETIAPSVSTLRIYLEGIIQELFASSSVENYFLGTKTSLARYLNQPMDVISEYITGKNDFIGLSDIPKSHKEKRESILIAIASLQLKGDVN